MSERACYIQRSDLGDRLESVRLVGGMLDESWTPPEGDAFEHASGAADWIADVLSDRSGGLGLLCVDTCGGVCAWLRPPGDDPGVTETLIRRSDGRVLLGADAAPEGDEDDFFQPTSEKSLLPDVSTPGGAGVQVLADPAAKRQASFRERLTRKGKGEAQPADPSRRVAAIALRDAQVRLILDDLDRRGIEVGSVISLWHALAEAWDPAGPLGVRKKAEEDNGAVVAESSVMTAIVLIDPAGRLVWVWSEKGDTVAAGSVRLGGPGPQAMPEASDTSRLVADWLSWSVQLGRGPGRVLVIVHEEEPASASALSPAAFGSALGQRWTGTSVDVAVFKDPIGETVRRLADRRAEITSPANDPRRSLVELANRPGRAHRRLYLWAGAAMGALAVALGLYAQKLNSASADHRRIASEHRRQSMEVYREHLAEPASGALAVMRLREQVEQARRRVTAPSGLPPTMPVMAEFDALALLLGMYGPEGLEVRNIQITQIGGSMTVLVNDLPMFDEFRQAMRGMGGSTMNWSFATPTQQGEKVSLSITGRWPEAGSQ
ncbi:MAG: hypothetical protein EA423_12020 [Phycisphaerales bacterium]|nr:MAG: hypothetical protein EA423_12020 [Phycisphaerales bacterium]